MSVQQTITARAIRRLIIEESKRANVGHIGSALSIADIIAFLFRSELNFSDPEDPSRDRFILSKGHAALALYAALHLKGLLTRDELATYCADGTLLGVHPEHRLSGIEFSTGSLGHGLSFGAGVALASRLSGLKNRAFVLVSDAECNEGSLWETVMFAGHHKLSNLVAVVDDNGQQALGPTKSIVDLRPLGEKWATFGWRVFDTDGHDAGRLKDTFRRLRDWDDKPSVVIASTVSGKGVSFMEGKVEWHYMPLSDHQYGLAMKELEEAPEE